MPHGKDLVKAAEGKTSILQRLFRPKATEERKYQEVQDAILRKYASIDDPELRRMTTDIMNLIETKASNIEAASDSFVVPSEPVGKYTLTLGGGPGLEVEVTGNSGYRTKVFQQIREPAGWKNSCSIGVNILYESQDYPHRFDDLIFDISKLARFIAPNYDCQGLVLCEGPLYQASAGWSNGKSSLAGNSKGLDKFSYKFEMDQDNLPVFLEAVRKIKSALQQPERCIAALDAKRLPAAHQR
jgi:hypothetical protein